MSELIDRLLLFLLNILIIKLNIDNEISVAYILLSMITVCATWYFKERPVADVLLMVLIGISLVFPVAIPIIIIGVYSVVYQFCIEYLLWRHIRQIKKIAIYVLAGEIICSILAVIAIFMIYEIQGKELVLFGMSLSVFLAVKESRLSESLMQIKRIRDDSIERDMILREKNKYLAENQEKEVHIAVLGERNRIAREIHDNVGHLLSRSILQVGAIMAVNREENLNAMLKPVKDTLDEAMNSIRESVHDLHKDSFDLENAARRIVDELSEYDVTFECDISLGASKEVKYGFLTILKEAVTNIIKHSDGDKVQIVMRELEGYYQMVVEDNGRNVSEKNLASVKAGIGLSNMEERVRNMSGIIRFSCEKGFRIFISVPKGRAAENA